MREDIYGALINAIERGSTLEQAVNSLVNSGYNVNEVREAASHISSGAISSTASIMELSRPKPIQQLNADMFKPLPKEANGSGMPRRKGSGKIIFLIIILLVLVGALISTLLFRQQVIDFISGLIS